MKPFDFLKALTETKEQLDFNNEEIKKDYQPYMINRFISMVDIYLPIVNEINKYNVPKETHFRYFQSIFPKRKQYFKYISKSKDLNQEEKQLIAQYFNVGLKDAERYINLLEEDQIQQILNVYKYGKGKTAAI